MSQGVQYDLYLDRLGYCFSIQHALSYNPGMSMISYEFKAKPRTSVNNKDIIRMYLDYNLLISQRSTPISASVYNKHIYTLNSFYW